MMQQSRTISLCMYDKKKKNISTKTMSRTKGWLKAKKNNPIPNEDQSQTSAPKNSSIPLQP